MNKNILITGAFALTLGANAVAQTPKPVVQQGAAAQKVPAPKSQAAKPVNAKPATAPVAAAKQLALPDQPTMVALVRSTVEAVNQANLTGYYGVVYMLGTESFRKANPVDAIAIAFKPFRDSKIDMSAALVNGPVLFEPAKIEGGKLKVNGIFYTKPLSIKYQFEYERTGERWSHSAVNIGLVSQ